MLTNTPIFAPLRASSLSSSSHFAEAELLVACFLISAASSAKLDLVPPHLLPSESATLSPAGKAGATNNGRGPIGDDDHGRHCGVRAQPDPQALRGRDPAGQAQGHQVWPVNCARRRPTQADCRAVCGPISWPDGVQTVTPLYRRLERADDARPPATHPTR